MFVQVMFLFAWIAAMQCTAIAKDPLCPYGSATECHEGFRLRHKEMLSHAAGLVHSAAEQGDSDHNKKPGSDAAKGIQKLLDDFKKVQEDATAAERDKERAVNAKNEVEEAEKEIKKHKTPSNTGSSWWVTPKTPVFQWDEAFIKNAKGDADSISQKTEQAKKKADETVQIAEAALKKAQGTIQPGTGTVEMTETDFQSIEKSIKDANDAIAEVRQNADAAEIAAYYVKTMMVSHSVFKTVEDVTYMSTKSKSLIKEAEDGLEEAASYLDIIPRKYVTQVKDFMKPIKALVDPLKELQSTSERAVHHAKALQTIINEDKKRIKDMTLVQAAECAWERASAAKGLIDKIADPFKDKTPFLNEAIKKVGESKAKGATAKAGYWLWSTFKATKEEIQEIKEAVAREKKEEEEEKQRKEKEGQMAPPPTPLVTKLFDPSINFPSEVKLPNCNVEGSKGDQLVNLDAIKPVSDRDDSTASTEGDGQEGEVKTADASGSNSERKGDKDESFRAAERPSSDGDISTKEPVDEEDIRAANSTESNEFSGNGSSTRVPRREGSRDSASTMPSACAYALLTLIMFLVTV